jgi:hypothetical protein
MQIVLIILTILAALTAVVLIAALFIKKDYAIERDIVIGKPTDEVFNYVKFLKNQDYYSKWVMTDPNMKKIFRGTDGTVGFVYGWNGNNKAGEGEQEITKIVNGQELVTEVRFVRPFAGVSYIHMLTKPVSENQTRVTWGMVGKSKFPLNVMNPFISGMLAKDLDISLQLLKDILEKKEVTRAAARFANAEA